MDFDFDNLVVTQQKKEYEKINPGMHNAICVGVWNVGPQETKYGIKNKFVIGFEVEQRYSSTQLQMLHPEVYTMSMHEKSKFAMLYESWIGKKLKDEERYKFNFNECIGKKATLNIVHGDKYVNISAILPPQDSNNIEAEDTLKGETPNIVKSMRAKAVINDQETKVNINDIKPVEKDTQSLQKTKLDQKAPF